MTTTFFLIRHAAHEDLGRSLTGRKEGARLGRVGRVQALRLAELLSSEAISAVYSSPRERTRETAAAIAIACETGPVKTVEEVDEIDFGEWSGKTFEELDQDAGWRRWNEVRDQAQTPAGESMADVQARALDFVWQLTRTNRGEAVAVVSHSDVIKAIVCHVLGLPIAHCFRFDIDPASVTTIVIGDWGAKLLRMNQTA
ncbi:histidine phosphatase family protein [Pseudaminobacter sp. 19-2017]|uniref:Histidine phosphatase family protein n=1 Tax=Pseudaminobacter soli (ex Zhang et al. 2022) TaxID=2831468 RepID=A0A942I6Q5_9HYPH|nr:histidine phosphatase family protein [Pseudaminobacter soli]MBS3647555.1 histidine phosphatase family protein [Pseudaminobacter soli]